MQNAHDFHLRHDVARALEILARGVRAGHVPTWLVDRIADTVSRDLGIVDKLAQHRATGTPVRALPAAVPVGGGETVHQLPCGCRRVERDGAVLSTAKCTAHREPKLRRVK